MPSSVFNTAYIQQRIDRWQAGDTAAMDDLYRRCGDRLETLARKMIKGYPWLRPVADASDVLQDAFVRLMHSLKAIRPASSRDFFNLAAVHIRRELIDLSRRVQARPELRHRREPMAGETPPDFAATGHPSPDDLDTWCRFHEAVEALPEALREAFSLVFYHAWPQDQIAELFGVDTRTIRRRWRQACKELQATLGRDVFDSLAGRS